MDKFYCNAAIALAAAVAPKVHGLQGTSRTPERTRHHAVPSRSTVQQAVAAGVPRGALERGRGGALRADTKASPTIESRAHDQFERAQRVANGQLHTEDLDWLSKGFTAFLAGGGAVALERCLRLPRNDSALRRACRNHWLRRAWESLDDELSPWRRSEGLANAVREFESRQWPRWRTLDDPPAKADRIEVALFQAFRSHERVPFTAMQLHNIAYHRRDS